VRLESALLRHLLQVTEVTESFFIARLQASSPYRFGQGVCFDIKLCGNIGYLFVLNSITVEPVR